MDRIIKVHSQKTIFSKRQLPYIEGISAHTAGTQHFCMHFEVIPPGGKAIAHYHDGFETAIYISNGRVETKYGSNLEFSSFNEAGEFLFIPPNLPHQPINLSDLEELIAVVSRNDPDEQESVVVYEIQKPGEGI